MVSVALQSLIVAVLAYQSFIAAPAEAQAEENSWRAESYFEMDSTDLAAYGDGICRRTRRSHE
jgi:hypothetical protein